MKFSCTNLRKNAELTKDSFDNAKLNVKSTYLFPASGTEEHAQVFMILSEPYRKKTCLHFKSPSWLNGVPDDMEDEDAIADLNSKVSALFPDTISCKEDLCLEARVHKTNVMSPLIFRDKEILSPVSVYYRTLENVDVIFCERVTSYTKTYDLSIVFKDKRVETHSCMCRKQLKEVESWAKKQEIEFYESGPDPLTWKHMFACHEDQTWKEISDRLNHVSSEEEEESEWEEGLTEDSEISETDFLSDTESECELFELPEDKNKDYAIGKKRVWYDSEEESCKRTKV